MPEPQETKKPMDSNKPDVTALVVACLSIIISLGSLWLSFHQFRSDRLPKLIIENNTLPIKSLSANMPTSITLKLVNTSKVDINYYLKAESNMGFLSGDNEKPTMVSINYESRILTLSNADAGKNTSQHTLTLKPAPGAVDMNILAYESKPDYYLQIQAIDADSGKSLFRHTCAYSFSNDTNTFGLYEPVMGPSQSSISLDSCN